MGTVAERGESVATRQLVAAYLDVLGRQHEVDLSRIPFDGGFDGARRVVDSLLGIEPQQCLPETECLLEWRAEKCEGRCEPFGHTALFHPDEPSDLPEPGTEARLRVEGGSHRVLVLSRLDSGLIVTRGPHRQERRMFKRASASGFAVVRVGGVERRASLADISEGGVSLAGEMLIEVGEHIDILLRIEGKRPLSFECEGLVVNCRKPQEDKRMDRWLGLQFTKLPHGMRDEIRRYVRDEPA